jgi:hypothetical protein
VEDVLVRRALRADGDGGGMRAIDVQLDLGPAAFQGDDARSDLVPLLDRDPDALVFSLRFRNL